MTIEELRRLLADPTIEFRPEIRWWLAEGLHTDETLRAEVAAAHRLGYGGLEFLAMDEEGVDHARYGWGSEEWVHDSRLIAEEATRLGMSVSFTSGTNWSNANVPTITPDVPAAAQELDVASEDLGPGERRDGVLPRIDLSRLRSAGVVREQHLVAVVAARVVEDEGDRSVLDRASIVDLTAQAADESLSWTSPDSGRWRLFAYWMHGTGQTASPSATVNHTVNYLEHEGVQAVIDYWRDVVLTPELRAVLARNPRTQMFMDSLELFTSGAGGLFWGPTVAAEFRWRRGYDIVPWLPFLTRRVRLVAVTTTYLAEPLPEDEVAVRKVRFDYARTLTDLYIERMLRPFSAFLHENGMTLRAQISYGLPFELTRPGPEVDGIETESVQFGAQIDAYRLLAGPAHLFGRPYSSETGATTKNHLLDALFFDQIIATQLAAGITRTVLHGWSSIAGAEGRTIWPGHEGMLPIFSERFDLRQPGAELYPLWLGTLARYQAVLRQGVPRIDVGILRTDHYTDSLVGLALLDEDGARIGEEEAYGRRWMRARENHWWQDLGMQDAGWSYEFFDGALLLRDDVRIADGVVQPDGPGYQALLVYQEELDPDAAAKLLAEARRGLRILLVHGAREVEHLMERRHRLHRRAAMRTPGLDGRDEELRDTVRQLLACPSVAEIEDPADTVDALRRLGVAGRAELRAGRGAVLSHLREAGTLTHLYLYSFLYETGEPTEVEVALEGVGAVHRIDPATGAVRPHAGTRTEGDRTVVTIRLHPGERALLTLDRTGTPVETAPEVEELVVELDSWQVVVESWDADDGVDLVTEDRGLGYETREVRPRTAVTPIPVAPGPLRSWRLLPEVGPAVSGVGDYRTTFDVAVEPGYRSLLDLGSTSGGLASVAVGETDPVGADTARPVVDVTDALRSGANTVVVRVASSLGNRLRERGYYEELPDVAPELAGGAPRFHVAEVRDHGLIGPVRLLRVPATRAVERP